MISLPPHRPHRRTISEVGVCDKKRKRVGGLEQISSSLSLSLYMVARELRSIEGEVMTDFNYCGGTGVC